MRMDAKKLSKKGAYSAVAALRDGCELTDGQLDGLLLYFAPALPALAKTPEQWVAKAVADRSEPRTYLRYIYVAAGKMVGCNGHRIHVLNTGWADGFYCPKTFERIDDSPGQYPDWQRIMPTPADWRGSAPARLEDMERGISHDRQIVDDPASGRRLDYEYVAQALNSKTEGLLHGPPDRPEKAVFGHGPFDGSEFTIMAVRK